MIDGRVAVPHRVQIDFRCRLLNDGRKCRVEISEETLADLHRRLRRIEGQVRGLQQMLADGRDCREVVTRISAASKALDQTGFLLVASGLGCVSNPEQSAAKGYALADVQRMFMKLA